MLLNQIAAVSEQTNQQLRALAVAEFQAYFPLFNQAEFYTMSGNADNPRKEDALIAAGTSRAIGDDYTAKTNTPDFAAAVLKIYGDSVKTDIAYERRGVDIASQRVLDLKNAVKGIARGLMDDVINSTLSATKIKGLKQYATDLSRKVVFGADANGESLPAGNASADKTKQAAFMELLEETIAEMGGASCIMANSKFIARLKTIARDYISIANVQDLYGQNQTVTTFNGIPIANPGYASNGTGLILPNNETEGTSTSICSSIYVVKFGEKSDVSYATNTGLDVKDLSLVGNAYQTTVELDIDQVILNEKSFKRIAGIKLG